MIDSMSNMLYQPNLCLTSPILKPSFLVPNLHQFHCVFQFTILIIHDIQFQQPHSNLVHVACFSNSDALEGESLPSSFSKVFQVDCLYIAPLVIF